MSGAWEELRTSGRPGPLTIALVYETVEAVRRFDRYPPPAGSDHWDTNAIQEFAHDFLVAEGAAMRLTKLVATANDEASFERVLEAAVRNEFRMQARRTETGAVLRALTHAVERDPDLVIAGTKTTRSWSLLEHAERELFAGDPKPLIDAAYAVSDVRPARWSEASMRRRPIAEPDSLRRVIRAVLTAAAAPLTPATMLEVILARFPLAVTGRVELAQASNQTDPAGADSALLANEVWEQLTDNERLVAGILDLPVREAAEEAGLSRSTAHRALASARHVLASYLSDVVNQAAVAAQIAAKSEMARMRGTRKAHSASRESEEA